MSYGVSAALQTAIYQALVADATLSGLVGTDIYDALPSGVAPSLYVALGPELAKDRSDKTGAGAEHEFTVSVVTDSSGFAVAKTAAAAVSDVLTNADLTLSRGSLVSLNFYRAKAVRVGTADERRIDLTFRARVQDD
ncbi:DUF3168 domain-containing protein [Octadecabacter sp. 1_MG-2023]|uniref:DUF3168 domain-containing protein n=1 Tax=unclassified Octadecabacter TaxID=196158 RepID=UPI001C0912AE|nr:MULTISPECIES: DUF3168 domain-containing protein [unclassified Octadecabacter]MBU2993703.1 DUF3168 domain-containing protein [Octadecabacter sp. B2R22]MDO6735453.1 DUF3168 domain-containing protein [Octadecabacter sp. 1_MG-2023]